MNRKILLIVLAGMIVSSNVVAQKNSKKNAGAAAGAIVGIAALALEYHLILEMLETKALNYTIENHPEMESFRLKVLDLDGKKLSDIGAMGVITYRITQLDKITGEEKERAILMMFTSKGWINEYGIDLQLVSWQKMDKNEWNELFVNFVELNSIIPVNKTNFTCPKCTSIPESKYNSQDSLHFTINDKFYRYDPQQQISIKNCLIKRDGLALISYNVNHVKSSIEIFPFIKLKNDDYRIADYSDKLKLFCNEHAMGLFMKNTNETIQLQRSLVKKIHEFLNDEDLL